MHEGIACEISGTHPSPRVSITSHAEIRIGNGSPLQGVALVREHYTS